MEKVEELLRESEMTVTEIALCGYNDISKFIQVFKNTMERPRRGTGKMLTLKIQYSKCAGGKNDDRNNEKRFGKKN